jgi:hypothetical protein
MCDLVLGDSVVGYHSCTEGIEMMLGNRGAVLVEGVDKAAGWDGHCSGQKARRVRGGTQPFEGCRWVD